MRSITCAWIVTSSAVVGSSAISSFGLERERHRDHHALAHAAAELVRVGLQPALGVRRCPTIPSSSPARARPAPWSMLLVRAASPRSAACRSVSTGLRLVSGSWKTIAMSVPRTLQHLGCRADPAATARRTRCGRPRSARPAAGSSRVIARLVTLLPQPDSPTRPSVSPASISKLHAVDGVDRRLVRPEAHDQVLDGKQGHRSSAPSHRLTRGSSASRSPSPMKLIDSTAIAMAAPARSTTTASGSGRRRRWRPEQVTAPARHPAAGCPGPGRQPRLDDHRFRHAEAGERPPAGPSRWAGCGAG